eukprot:GAHX01005776.1.p1 GENE.GAHX01005776.1~~GAHX01005776.1.p1  ORF type:complete len:54 (-),score=3.18 GAHX01005776.1:112-273(-)
MTSFTVCWAYSATSPRSQDQNHIAWMLAIISVIQEVMGIKALKSMSHLDQKNE